MRIQTRVATLWRKLGWLVLTGMIVLSVHQRAFCEESWWNEDFQYRKKISFDTTPSGADIQSNLSDVQVLVRLHSGNMNFTNTQETGEDIRFVAADDKTLLKHHLESFDGLDEIAAIWVRLPRVSGASNLDYIWMYYGNKKAVGGQEPKGTFGDSAAVFHFAETQGMPGDSSEKNIPVESFSGGQGLPGVMGNGFSLNGVSDYLAIKAHPLLDMNKGFSVSAWIKIPSFLDNAVLFERKGDQADLLIGIDQADLYCQVSSEDGQVISTEKTAALSPGSWHPVAITGTPEGLVTIYVDGIKIDWVNLNKKLPLLNGDMIVGSSTEKDRFFTGELDEVRIYPSVLSEDRIRLDFATQGQDRACVSAGMEMVNESGGLPLIYLGTVFRNITLDGWLIITILMILGIMSWAVILFKGITFHLMGKENRFFRQATGQEDDRSMVQSQVIDFQYSSLSRIYQAGIRSLKKWIDPDKDADVLTSRQMDQVKSELEKGLIEETVRMNTWMTVLTMSISGGPFLGLLGTVWGVMNTFAAMAEAGDANIMAIAPGVASALSTTVFGLIVAIPALFGYNYLSTRIRRETIGLNVYVDELSLRVDRLFGDDK
ncbi:MAG: DUF2341 domain-containing protein [Proteobacteria bacterium]|nr:DUF2341 domain-containing protein [Pseudomonadota bacterium]